MEALLNKAKELCALAVQKNSELDAIVLELQGDHAKLATELRMVGEVRKALRAERAAVKGVKDVVVLKVAADEALAMASEELAEARLVAVEGEKKIRNTRSLMVSERATLDNRKEGLDGRKVDLDAKEEKLKESTKKVKEAAKKLGIKL